MGHKNELACDPNDYEVIFRSQVRPEIGRMSPDDLLTQFKRNSTYIRDGLFQIDPDLCKMIAEMQVERGCRLVDLVEKEIDSSVIPRIIKEPCQLR